MIVKRLEDFRPFTAVDESEIVEVIGLKSTDINEVSLARAIIKPGKRTRRHYHKFHEIYMIASGKGIMHLNNETKEVKTGDNILIPPKSWHFIENICKGNLEIWCICVPAFRQEETEVGE